MHPPVVTVAQFQRQLEQLLDSSPSGTVVFDADGTLWQHDVGVMTFEWAIDQRLLYPSAVEALLAFSQAQGLGLVARDVHELARALQHAFAAEQLGERAAAEMQVWVYVDYCEAEFRELVRRALAQMGHLRTLHREIVELAAWVRNRGAHALIVSASPQWVVEEAAATLGFGPEEIVAGCPELRLDATGIPRIAPRLRAPLPYGPDKVDAGRKRMGSRPWLAALGDSSFDLDMFRQAPLAAGIGSKPGMLAGLAQLPHGVRLQLQP